MSTKEKIEVMQAWLDGEPIEFCYQTLDGYSEWTALKTKDEPIWSWDAYKYRVKPKLRYIPFKSAEEFLEAQRKHGTKIGLYEDNVFYNTYVSSDKEVLVVTCNGWSKIDFFELNKYWFFEDGTHCGKLVNN